MKKKKTSKPGKAPRPTPSGPPVEAFDALDTWAGEVAACLPQSELGVLVGIYRRIGGDRRVSADNRKLAQRQANALRKFVKE